MRQRRARQMCRAGPWLEVVVERVVLDLDAGWRYRPWRSWRFISRIISVRSGDLWYTLLVDLHLRVGVPGVLPLGEGCDEVRVMGEEAGQ